MKAIVVWLLLALPCAAQIEPLTPHSIVLTQMPATIAAPLGANDYTWFTPPGITLEIGDDPHQLTFTANPGTYQIRCKTLTIDWEAQTLTPKTHIATFIVGTPPDPDDGDDDDDDDTSCESVPNDKWQVGKVACRSGQVLPATAKQVAPQFVALYADVAGKVKRFELKTPAAVTAALKAGTDPILASLSQSDVDAWKMDWSTSVRTHMEGFPRPGMGDLPEYYQALSDGLKAVK